MNDSDVEEHCFEILPGIFSFSTSYFYSLQSFFQEELVMGGGTLSLWEKETTGIARKSHCSTLSPKFDFERAIGRQES